MLYLLEFDITAGDSEEAIVISSKHASGGELGVCFTEKTGGSSPNTKQRI